MKNKALFSSKDKSKKLKCRVLQFLIGALSVITPNNYVTRTLRIRLVTPFRMVECLKSNWTFPTYSEYEYESDSD